MLIEGLGFGSRWTLVGGKGGVGKTTVAAALAVALAERGEHTLVVSVDPAHSLGDALGAPLGAEPGGVPGVPTLWALEVDVERERAAFLARHRAALAALLERGTYLAADEVERFLDLAVPGIDEVAALLRLIELARADAYARVVVDTAPTGHALRLLATPALARGWLGALEALEARHAAVAQRLAPGFAGDHTRRFLDLLAADVARLTELLRDAARTRFLLVTTPEPVVLAETRRYRRALDAAGVALGGVVVNRVAPRARAGAAEFDAGVPTLVVPLLAEAPTGVAGLRRFAALARPPAAPAAPRAVATAPGTASVAAGAAAGLRVGPAYLPPLGHRLYLLGGKGGVGKTTVSSALAVWLADAGRGRVLLLSTDPAGSLFEVWGVEVGGAPVAAPGAPGLELRQLDAAAAWAEFRARYRDRAARFFTGLLGGGLSLEADRRVVERLVDLAPPGLDEVMALFEVVDRLGDPAYNALVLDTAPTGHLLRLLEMPELALQWAHAVMRLLLRYREAVGLGELAEDVLALARSVRALRGRLQDAAQTWVAAVALPEALSVPETARLLPRLRALGMPASALFVNRLLAADGGVPAAKAEAARALLAAEAAPPAVAAPEWAVGPVGADELRRFARAWRHLEPIDPQTVS